VNISFFLFWQKGSAGSAVVAKVKWNVKLLHHSGAEKKKTKIGRIYIVLFPFLFSVHVGYRKYILEMLGGPGERVEFA
jgi:hypothetical protein